MSSEMKMLDIISRLHDFIQMADAAFPDMPDVTLTFPTPEALQRFRVALRADLPLSVVYTGPNNLPLGVEVQLEGINLKLRVNR